MNTFVLVLISSAFLNVFDKHLVCFHFRNYSSAIFKEIVVNKIYGLFNDEKENEKYYNKLSEL